MKIYHVAAISENHVIGSKGKIPWQIREDLQRFREITMGHPIIMGRKTFESMLPYAPLKGRFNIILSRRHEEILYEGKPVIKRADGVMTVNEGTTLALVTSLDEAFDLCKHRHEVYIIGGQRVYEDTLDIADEIRLTIVHREVYEGDAFYPPLDPEIWKPSYTEPHEKYSFVDYVRHYLHPHIPQA